MTEFQYDPADDSGMTTGERWSSPRREPGLVSRSVGRVARLGVLGYLKLYHGLTVTGRERFPVDRPCVVVANHSSHLDVLCLVAALPVSRRADAFPVAAGDTFFTTAGRTLFAALALNAVPLWRRKATRHGLDDLRAKLRRPNCTLIVFPEGTRSRDGAIGSFKPGLGMVVAETDAVVVPCGLSGCHGALPPGRRFPRRCKLGVRVGEAIDRSDLSNDREGWEALARRSESAVRNLAEVD